MHTNYQDEVEESIVMAFVADDGHDTVYKKLFTWAVNEGITNRVDFNTRLVPMETNALKSQFPDGVNKKVVNVMSSSAVRNVSCMPPSYQAARSAIGGALEAGFGLDLDEDGNPKQNQAELKEKNPNKRAPRPKDARVLKAVAAITKDLEDGPFKDIESIKRLLRDTFYNM